MQEYNIQQGIEQSIKLLENIQRRPLIVGVYGLPNHGKSYFVDLLGSNLENRGISTYRGSSSLSESFFEQLKQGSESFKQVLLIHCAWDRKTIYLPGIRHIVNEEQDPNALAEKVLKREVDLNIGIYNPNFPPYALNGDYDILINNPDSKRKVNPARPLEIASI